jgi:hypothetical protein
MMSTTPPRQHKSFLGFHFHFGEPVWYYSPTVGFPSSKMLPGFVIGIAPNVGESFAYVIQPEPVTASKAWPDVLTRSVVQSRDSDATPGETLLTKRKNKPVVADFNFYKEDLQTGKAVSLNLSDEPEECD